MHVAFCSVALRFDYRCESCWSMNDSIQEHPLSFPFFHVALKCYKISSPLWLIPFLLSNKIWSIAFKWIRISWVLGFSGEGKLKNLNLGRKQKLKHHRRSVFLSFVSLWIYYSYFLCFLFLYCCWVEIFRVFLFCFIFKFVKHLSSRLLFSGTLEVLIYFYICIEFHI